MSDWGGFSEAELSRLRSGGDVKPKVNGSAPSPSSKKGLGGAVKKTTKKKKTEKVPDGAMLPSSTPTQPEQPAEPVKQLEKAIENEKQPVSFKIISEKINKLGFNLVFEPVLTL